ncbi:MAG: restriction endonuclease subunit S, partial [Planctomycetota bacterium]|nr:restriction endonuclease subunit S [Planctomycetota bacterium]
MPATTGTYTPLDRCASVAHERGGSPRPIQNFITSDPKGINWIKIGDATASGKYIYKTQEKIKPEGVSRSRMVYEGDFILSNSMSFGRPYIMKTAGCIHDGWLVLHRPKVNPDYLYYVLGS